MGNSQSSRADTMTKAPTKEHIHWSSQSARGRKSTKSDETFTTYDLQSTEVQFIESSNDSNVDTDSDSDADSIESDEEGEGMFNGNQFVELVSPPWYLFLFLYPTFKSYI